MMIQFIRNIGLVEVTACWTELHVTKNENDTRLGASFACVFVLRGGPQNHGSGLSRIRLQVRQRHDREHEDEPIVQGFKIQM